MKKYISILIMIVCIFSITGCINNNEIVHKKPNTKKEMILSKDFIKYIKANKDYDLSKDTSLGFNINVCSMEELDRLGLNVQGYTVEDKKKDSFLLSYYECLNNEIAEMLFDCLLKDNETTNKKIKNKDTTIAKNYRKSIMYSNDNAMYITTVVDNTVINGMCDKNDSARLLKIINDIGYL